MADLAAAGVNDVEIARRTGIPVPTLRKWRYAGLQQLLERRRASLPDRSCSCRNGIDPAAYSHLLGLYLGDGCLARNGTNSLRLTISCDARYPRLIEEAAAVMEQVSLRQARRQVHGNCVVVHRTWMHWRCLFPQHGAGLKHLRRIELRSWQRGLVIAESGLFLRGLVNSDGCRVINRVKGHEYVRYQFSNRSEDIRGLFGWACTLVGAEWRRSNAMTISVSRRASVEILEGLIGQKS